MNLILASNTLTAPPPSSSAAAASSSTPSEPDSSPKNDLLTIEEISELFEKQIKKLENSSNIEVNILLCFLKKFVYLFDSRKKFSMISIRSFN